MSDDGRWEPDTRERAQLLREVARQFREVDPAELTADQLRELCEVMPSAATRGEPSHPANVQSLPVRPGPDARLRRLRLSFAAVADDAERTADDIDRRLDARGESTR
ncbi:hypothetical protein [Mycolicibacter sinensis]|uniref:Uncharacterized protein n=1 Tax=Mycolicibacter sinensis (strain JDM601) TaxID=875328 RepID=A0A1A2XW07_MYCSD|nr:hypothetical protein [Mycolicibacter sinensis]OBI29061.1 hypothetical protein A5710_22695 [Mycolicibacter sinensis]